MKIVETNQTDLNNTYSYICSLCGYPALSQDKINILTSFLRNQHGYNTVDELTEAYNQLAAGRLDEKMDSFKSLTGLSASRVLSAFMRERGKGQDTGIQEPPEGKSWTSDDTRSIIRNYNGRVVLFNEDVTEDEYKMLMQFWINRHYHTWKEREGKLDRDAFLTIGTYRYLEKQGLIRIQDDQLQAWDGKAYVYLAPVKQVKEMAIRLQFSEDMQLNKDKSIKDLRKKQTSMTVSDAEQKVAVGLYFASLQNEPF